MKLNLVRCVIAAVCLNSVAMPASSQEAFREQPFSLYGYVVNFFNVNLYSEGWRVTDSDYGNVLYGRLKGDWNPGDTLSFHSELAYDAAIGNQNPYTVLGGYGQLPAYLTDPQVVFNEDLIQSVSVDHLWGSVSFGRFDIQFGKLPIAWGTGYFFNPTAKTATLPFLDTVSEETPGTIGVIPSVSFFGGLLSLQGYAAFQDKGHSSSPFVLNGDWGNLPFGVKLQGIVGSFDLSVSWIKEYSVTQAGYNRLHYLGADFVGAVWNFGVYGEAALKMWDEGQGRLALAHDDFADLLEVCAGFDYLVPVLDIDIRLEYYHQGSGVSRKSAYDVSKLLSGEQVVLAEDYLLFYVDRSFMDYFSVSAAGLVNLNDGSWGFVPELGGQPYANFEVALGAMLFFGPEGSEFDGRYPGFDLTEPAVYLLCKLSF